VEQALAGGASRALALLEELGHEELVLVHDRASGLRAIVAIHDTTLGPAVGGTRMRMYPTLDDAAVDALRLARAMTYKSAMAGLDRGGAKAVIVGDPARDKTRALLAAYAKLVDRFGGRFATGADMGIDLRDVAVLARLSRWVGHTPREAKHDAADFAAIGVFEGIAAAARALGRPLSGLHVTVQGLGQVGYRLARQLAAAGARLTVCDVDEARAERAAEELKAEVARADAIYDVAADVFSPNAAGGVLNDDTVPRLRCGAVVGGANEQLLEPRHGDALHERGILYGPDYVVNAGGLLSILFESGEIDEDGLLDRIRQIGDRVVRIWDEARRQQLPPHRVADRMAEQRLEGARAARRTAVT
jgi:leucine dehydrogenase